MKFLETPMRMRILSNSEADDPEQSGIRIPVRPAPHMSRMNRIRVELSLAILDILWACAVAWSWARRNIFGIYVVAATVLLILVALTGCSPEPARAGTDQAAADAAQGRADTAASAAQQAEASAAEAHGASVAADLAAEQQPTAARIAAAADARVVAARKQAESDALARLAARLAVGAHDAAVKGKRERLAEQRAADLLRWADLCRWIGLAGVAGGVALAGLLAWAGSPRAGLGLGGLLVGTGLAVVAYGATLAWIPWALPVVAAVAGIVWASKHRRAIATGTAFRSVAEAASRALDAVESAPHPDIRQDKDDAKAALGKAVASTGLVAHFEKLRGPKRLWRSIPMPPVLPPGSKKEFKPHDWSTE